MAILLLRPVLYSMLCISFCGTRTAAAQQANTEKTDLKSAPPDILWMQKMLDNWEYVCLKELHLSREELPWIIFYDSSHAWHINPDQNLLPPFERTDHHVVFAEKQYPLVRVAHITGHLWVPDREPIPWAAVPTATMPYAEYRKTFFIAPLPSLFHTLVPTDQSSIMDFLFLGVVIHELTHTLQLPFVLPQLLEIQKTGSRESLDDNTVESEFSQNERYKKLYNEESMHLWNAVFIVNDDSCIAKIEEAFRLMDLRKREFFSGDHTGLGKADEIFLSLEGSAMWAQYRIMLKNTPNPIERELLSWIVTRGPAWSQDRGLVLFLLIARFDDNWRDRFFGRELPAASAYLRDILAARKR